MIRITSNIGCGRTRVATLAGGLLFGWSLPTVGQNFVTICDRDLDGALDNSTAPTFLTSTPFDGSLVIEYSEVG